jgi:hypothetical protein
MFFLHGFNFTSATKLSIIKIFPRISLVRAKKAFRTSLFFGLPENQAMLPGKVADVFFN